MTEPSHHTGSRSPEYALLGFLYTEPSHGYTLHQQLVTELGQVWHISQSQAYNILKRLESQGYLSATTQEQEKLPPRQVLQITDAGRRRFEEWLQTPSGSSVHAIRLEFITRLYFARRLFPDLIAAIIAGEAADIDTTLARLEAARTTIPNEQTFNRLSLDLRLQQLRAVREWVIQCRQTLEI